jgi:hypothetical protein
MASKSYFTPEEWKNNRRRCANGRTCGYMRQSQRAVGRDERDVVPREPFITTSNINSPGELFGKYSPQDTR